MSFIRTPSGVANYSYFLGAEIIVFTEGKVDGQAKPILLADEIFYAAILKHLLGQRTFKIKCVGNKEAALGYADAIENSGIKNGLVFIDKDFCDLTHSIIPKKCVVQTRGYSWENDFWTQASCLRVLELLTNGIPPTFAQRYRNLESRMRLLGIMDAALQPLNQALLVKKSDYGGINFDFASVQPIPLSEIKRLIRRYRSHSPHLCGICSQIRTNAGHLPTPVIVQGHIWSNAIRGLIARTYREEMNEVAPSKRALLNLALSQLSGRLNSLLGRNTVSYYRQGVRRALA